jgi:hypothetical protein
LEISKVIVEVQLDFSEESDKALKVLFNVAEELLDKYNLWVEIIPVHLWFTDPLEAELSDLPKIFINGKLRFIGKAPSKREATKAILEHAGLPPKTSESTGFNYVRADFDGGLPDAVLASEYH